MNNRIVVNNYNGYFWDTSNDIPSCNTKHEFCSPILSRRCDEDTKHFFKIFLGDDGYRHFHTEGCPGHDWSENRYWNAPLIQNISGILPLNPVLSLYPVVVDVLGQSVTEIIGIAINGVPFYSGMKHLNSGPDLDSCGGRVDDLGRYYYAKNVSCLFNDSLNAHSPLIGFMLDGFPLFGPRDRGGLFADTLLGSDKLDECNGHVDAENTFYHYHVRSSYPFLMTCLKGCLNGISARLNHNIPKSRPCIPSNVQFDYSQYKRASWSSGSKIRKSGALRTWTGTTKLLSWGTYPLSLKYRRLDGLGSINVKWSFGENSPKTDEGYLYARNLFDCGPVPCANASLTVQPSVPSPAEFLLFPGNNVWPQQSTLQIASTYILVPKRTSYQATAGMSTFILISRDGFGNARTVGGDSIVFRSLFVISSGVCQDAFTNHIILENNAESVDSFYDGMTIEIIAGTGAGQRVTITSYVGTSRMAEGAFATVPDTTSLYLIGTETQSMALDQENGTYFLRGEFSQSGQYSIWILMGLQHVATSPIYVHVNASLYDVSSSVVIAPLVWPLGSTQSAWIIAKDAFGNNVSTSVAFADGCTEQCEKTRFSAIIRAHSSSSTVCAGQILFALNNISVTLDSSASMLQGQYVGMVICAAGFTRTIVSHGGNISSSASNGRVITVNNPFPYVLAAGTTYYIAQSTSVFPVILSVCRIHNVSISLYKVSCPSISETGDFSLEIASYGAQLMNSPIALIAVPSWTCASTSYAAGIGLTLSTAGLSSTFKIIAKDSSSQYRAIGGDSFCIIADQPGLLSAGQVCGSGTGQETISDLGTGLYRVSYFPTRSGLYFVTVNLGRWLPISGSPFALQIYPSSVCAVRSVAYGAGLTIATVSVQSRFLVDAKDQYSNFVNYLDMNSQSCSDGGLPASCLLTFSLGDQSWHFTPRNSGFLTATRRAGWDILYTLDRPTNVLQIPSFIQISNNSIFNIVPGGLFATYYFSDNFTSPFSSVVDSSIDFLGPAKTFKIMNYQNNWLRLLSLPKPQNYLMEVDSPTSIRWVGLFQSSLSAAYSFIVKLGSGKDRVKLWIDNTLLIDQWTSLIWMFPTGTITLNPAASLFDLVLEYKSYSVQGRASLFWGYLASSNPLQIPVTSSDLFRSSPFFTTWIQQAKSGVASYSSASGNFLTLTTAGIQSSFTITARDPIQGIISVNSSLQRFSFSARKGQFQGSLHATYYFRGTLISKSQDLSLTRQDPGIFLSSSTTFLSAELSEPTEADEADLLQVFDASVLNLTTGINVQIDKEIMTVLYVADNIIQVRRGQHASTPSKHLIGAQIFILPSRSMATHEDFSVRWSGFVQPQYAETYTYYVSVAAPDDRVKLWVDDLLLVDAWSSISSTALIGTWPCQKEEGLFMIEAEYHHAFGVSGITVFWQSFSLLNTSISSARIFAERRDFHASISDTGTGRYIASYISTVSGLFQSMLYLNTMGGLMATYYSNIECTTFANNRIDPTVDFRWGGSSPAANVPADGFCVHWSGMIRSLHTDLHTFFVETDDSARLWIDHKLLIFSESESRIPIYSGTIQLIEGILYPIKLEYIDRFGKARIGISWNCNSFRGDTIAAIRASPQQHSREDTKFSINDADVNGGVHYVDGDIVIRGGRFMAKATFSVDDTGSINTIEMQNGGSGFKDEPNPSDFDILYPNSFAVQSGTVTSIRIYSPGVNFVSGYLVVSGGSTPAIGNFNVDKYGRILSVQITDPGSGFSRNEFNLGILTQVLTSNATAIYVGRGDVLRMGIASKMFLLIDSEVFLVNMVSGNRLDVLGAQAGSVTSMHAAGAVIVTLRRALAAPVSPNSTVVYLSPADIISMGISANTSILVGEEVMLVTNVSHSSLIVARAQSDTAMVSHELGSPVTKLPPQGAAFISEDSRFIFLIPNEGLHVDIAVDVFIKVDEEIMLIESILNGNITVSRGQAFSMIISHEFGSIVNPLRRVIANTMASDSDMLFLSPADIKSLGISVGDFIRIDHEILLVMLISLGSCTVLRGQSGSAPTVHMLGSKVFLIRNLLSQKLQVDTSILYLSPKDIAVYRIKQQTLLSVDDEIIEIFSIQGNSFIINRGIAETTATIHAVGALISPLNAVIAQTLAINGTTVYFAVPYISNYRIVPGVFVRIEDEVLQVVGILQSSLFVSRGQAGSTPAEHPMGSRMIAFRNMLVGSISSSTTILFVSPIDILNMNLVSGCLLRIDDEVMLVGNINVSTGALTVFRGQAGSTSQDHNEGSLWVILDGNTAKNMTAEESVLFVSVSYISNLSVANNSLVQIDAEIMLVTAVDRTLPMLTILRGFAGTVAAPHNLGAKVVALRYVAANQLSEDSTSIFLSPNDVADLGILANIFIIIEMEVLLVKNSTLGNLTVLRAQAETVASSHSQGSSIWAVRAAVVSTIHLETVVVYISPADLILLDVVPNVFLKIDDEIMLVTSVESASVSVIRAQAGSMLSSHRKGTAITTLYRVIAAPVNSSSSTIYVSPSYQILAKISENTYVQIDLEVMLVTSVASGALTVSRGQLSTLACPHLIGALVQSFALNITANISSSDSNIFLSFNSTTAGIVGGMLLKINDELMLAITVSGNAVAVQRGQLETSIVMHTVGSKVVPISRVIAADLSSSASFVYLSPYDELSMQLVSNSLFKIDSEIILLCNASAGTLNVKRGQAGTLASNHTFGATLIPLVFGAIAGVSLDLTRLFVNPYEIAGNDDFLINTFIKVDDEILLVQGVMQDSFLVLRSQAGTKMENHLFGARYTVLRAVAANSLSSDAHELYMSPSFMYRLNIVEGSFLKIDMEIVLVISANFGKLIISRGHARTIQSTHTEGASISVFDHVLATDLSRGMQVGFLSPATILHLDIRIDTFIRIDEEIMLVASIDNGSLYLVRAQATSTEADHGSGALVTSLRQVLAAEISAVSNCLFLSPADIVNLEIISNMFIKIDQEILLVGNTSGGNVSVTREQANTIAAVHFFGATVTPLQQMIGSQMDLSTNTVFISIADVISQSFVIGLLIRIDSEIVLVSSVVGSLISVERGQAGTTATNHYLGASFVSLRGASASALSTIDTQMFLSPVDIQTLEIVVGSLIKIDDEVVLVTAVDGACLYIMRAQAESAASNHKIGAAIFSLRRVLSSRIDSFTNLVYLNPIDVLKLGITSSVLIQVDKEFMQVIGISGSTLKVVRGELRSAIQGHHLGALVMLAAKPSVLSCPAVDVLYGDTGFSQVGSITSVDITGNISMASEGAFNASISCESPCTGYGFEALCSIYNGVGFSFRILSHGSGFRLANPPNITCPGIFGILISPNIAEGVVLSPNVAVGALLRAVRSHSQPKYLDSSVLYPHHEPINSWSGSQNLETLMVSSLSLCGSASTIVGVGLDWSFSLATVGASCQFSIQARDQYGNICPGPDGNFSSPDDQFIIHLTYNENSGGREILKANSDVVPSSTLIGLSTAEFKSSDTTRAGMVQFQSVLAIQGGLCATYYISPRKTVNARKFASDFENVGSIVNRCDQTVDFSSSTGIWPSAPQCLTSPAPFSARWAGFIRQNDSASMLCNLSFALASSEERVRLWISNSLVIDQWSSLSSFSPSLLSQLIVNENSFYSIQIDYKVLSWPRRISLQLLKNGSGTPVQSSWLYQASLLNSNVMTEAIIAREPSGEDTLLAGSGVTLSTAYLPSSFMVFSRDDYSNIVPHVDPYILRVTPSSGTTSRGTVESNPEGKLKASYLVTSFGLHTISLSLPKMGGLYATYFSLANLTNAVDVRVDKMSSPLTSLSPNLWPGRYGLPLSLSNFSVRWEGLIRPDLPLIYGFKTNLIGTSSRVRMWVDNNLIIDQWASLSLLAPYGSFQVMHSKTYYGIQIEYKTYSLSTSGLGLQWFPIAQQIVIISHQGCIVGCLNSTISVDIVGAWAMEIAVDSFSSSYLTDGNQDKGISKVVFTFPEARGIFVVQAWYPSNSNFANNVPVQIRHCGGISTYVLDETELGGTWRTLGTYAFDRSGGQITIANKGTSSLVAVDSIRFVRTAPQDEVVLDAGLVQQAMDARTIALGPRSSLATILQQHSMSLAYIRIIIRSESRNLIHVGKDNVVKVDRAFSMGKTELVENITETSLTLLVQSAAGGGIIVGNLVEIDTELLLVMSILTDMQLMVQRAQQGTAAQSHNNGSCVRRVLLPGTIVDSGLVSNVSSTSSFTLSPSSPTLSDWCTGYELVMAFDKYIQPRTIVACYSSRNVTVSPAFDSAPIANVSRYYIIARVLFMITAPALYDETGDKCDLCAIPQSMLFALPQVNSQLVVVRGLDRSVVAAGSCISIATAGLAAAFNVTVKDRYGNTPPDVAILFVNATSVDDLYGYGTTVVMNGVVAKAGDRYSFFVGNASSDLDSFYVGYNITVAGETRVIVQYSSSRLVQVNVPFSQSPELGSSFTITTTQNQMSWFSASVSGFDPTAVSFLATASGLYSLSVQIYRVGGVQANYYHNPWLQGSPSMNRVDSNINFDWGTGLVTPSARDYIGIRWNGLLTANFSEVYTFFAVSRGFGPRLRINGNLVIDQIFVEAPCIEFDPSGQCIWYAEFDGNLTETSVYDSAFGTAILSEGQYYDFQLEYRTLKGSSSIKLYWQSYSQSLEVVPSSNLFYAFEKAEGSPFLLRVRPSSVPCGSSTLYSTDFSKRCTVCGSAGSLRGIGLTITTAGLTSTFDFVAKDQYGNVRDSQNTTFLARVSGNSSCGSDLSGEYLEGLCVARTDIRPTVHGIGGLYEYAYGALLDSFGATVSVSEVQLGGLFATYYENLPCPIIGPMRASGVQHIQILSAGSACSQDGMLTATGGGPGFGFSAYFKQRLGSVYYVSILNAGQGYDSNPKIDIVAPTTCIGTAFRAIMQFSSTDETRQNYLSDSPNHWWSSDLASAGATLVDCGFRSPYRVVIDQQIDFSGSSSTDSLPVSDWPNVSPSAIEFTAAGLSTINGVYYRSQPFLKRINSSYPYYVLQGDPHMDMGLIDAYFSVSGGYIISQNGSTLYTSQDSFTGPWMVANGSYPPPSFVSMPFPSADNFFVRWAGFVSPQNYGGYTFQASVAEEDERLKVWVDNSILIDQWNSLSTLLPSGYYSSMDPTNYYSIQYIYKDFYGAHLSRLSWKFGNQTMTVIPSSNLYVAFQAEGSPSWLHVHPSLPCSSTSTVRGIGISLTTAGVYVSFSVSAKDAYGNVRPYADAIDYKYVASIHVQNYRTVYPEKDDLQNFHYAVTSFGTVMLNTYLALAGGLQATYYLGTTNFTGYSFTQKESVLDFSSSRTANSSEWPGRSSRPEPGFPFSARWTGFLSPPYADMYTFSAQLIDDPQATFSNDTDERVRMWIDNQLIIDQWTSISRSWPTGTFQALQPNFLHEISVDFKSNLPSRRFSLNWESGGPNVAAACEFSSPAPYPPDFDVDICGWRLDSSCDDDSSYCVLPIQKIMPSDFDSGFPQLNRSRFGKSVASTGDLNGDGVNDVLVGAPGDLSLPGKAYIIFLTKNGAPLMGIAPESFMALLSPNSAVDDAFGNAVCVIGDLDGNGLPELAVAANGSIYVVFLQKGSFSSTCTVCPPTVLFWDVLNTSVFVGDTAFDSLTAVPDLDKDGTPELAAGSISDDTGGNDCGAVIILFLSTSTCSGARVCLKSRWIKYADGLNGFTQSCGSSASKFGSSVAWIGDVSGDGVGDIAVGAKGDDCGGTDNGAAWILLLNSNTWDVRKAIKLCSGVGGLDSSLLPSVGCAFGASIGAAGDLNKDGIPDIVVSSASYGTWKGAIFWISLSRAGTVLFVKTWGEAFDSQEAHTCSQGFGTSIAVIDDQNRDGMHPDALIGCAYDNNSTGSAMVVLSASWTKWTMSSESAQLSGPAVPLSGSSTPYATGKSCDDGSRYPDSDGSRDTGQYSFLFKGFVPDCESICMNDGDCNFFTVGSKGTNASYHHAGATISLLSQVLSGWVGPSDTIIFIALKDIASSFLAVDDFVKLNDEIVLVTNISGSAISILRAQAGSSPAAHVKGVAFTVLKNAIAADVDLSISFTLIYLSPASVASLSIKVGKFIQINDEVMLVLNIEWGLLYVQRQQAGTSVQFHSVGAAVHVVSGVASIAYFGTTVIRYFPFASSESFYSANYTCDLFASILSRVDSDAEFQTIWAQMSMHNFASIILGVTYVNGWKYSDLSSIRYSSWAAGEPNTLECCSMMANGYWKGVACSASLPFFCTKVDTFTVLYISPWYQAYLGIFKNVFVYVADEAMLVVDVDDAEVTVVRAQAGTARIDSKIYAANLKAVAPFSLVSNLTESETIIYLNPLDIVSMGLDENSFVKIDDEVFLVTSFFSGTLAVSRGQAGTSSSSHSAGALVLSLIGVTSSTMDAGTSDMYMSPADLLALNIVDNTLIAIEGEVVLVLSVAGTYMTLVRAMAGSTASAHSIGAAVIPLRRVLATAVDATSNSISMSPVDISALGIIEGSSIQIDLEIMLVVGIAGSTLAVERAQSATSSASHSTGALIQGLNLRILRNITSTDSIVTISQYNVTTTGIDVGVLIGIDNELLLVTAVAGNSVYVSRGLAETSPATHSGGAHVVVLSRVTATAMTLISTVLYVSPFDVTSLRIRNNSFIQVESEIMLITAIRGGALTVLRSQAGTSASTHPSGSLLYYFQCGLAVSIVNSLVTKLYISPAKLIDLGISVNYFVAVDQEVLLVTDISSADGALNVARGQANTSPTPHSAGALLTVLPRNLAAQITSLSTSFFLSPSFISSYGVIAGKLVYIDSELMLVDTVSTASVTVTRGQAGSTATTHLFGAAVFVIQQSALAISCSIEDSTVYMNPVDVSNISVTIGSYVRIDDEILLVNAISGPSLSVSRGMAGTKGSSHIAGSSILGVSRFSLATPVTAASTILYLNPIDALVFVSVGPGALLLVDSEVMQAVSNFTGGLNVIRGAGRLCTTMWSCEKEVQNPDHQAITRQKSSYLLFNARNFGNNTNPGSASFVSPPGLFSSLSFWYFMYGDGAGSIIVELMSVFEAQCTGFVTGIVSSLAFVLDESASPSSNAWTGMYITIGEETRLISAYASTREVTVEFPFSPALVAVGSKYLVRSSLSRCYTQSACNIIPSWTQIWAVARQQQQSNNAPWTQQLVELLGFALPLQVRIRGVRGPTVQSNLAIDRILLRQLRTPLSGHEAWIRLVPFQVLPSSRLYSAFHISGSPFSVAVRPGRLSRINTKCIAGCNSFPNRFSSTVIQNLTITLLDSWGNLRSPVAALENDTVVSRPGLLLQSGHEDGLAAFVQSLSNPAEQVQLAFNYSSAATYLASYSVAGLDETGTVNTFAVSSLVIRIARAGGLLAAYYSDVDLLDPAMEQVDATIDFSSTSSPPGTAGLVPPNFFSVRWRGMVCPIATEVVTFMTVTSSSSGLTGREGVRLRSAGLHIEDLTLLIDAWDGPASVYSATLQLEGERLYDLQLDYRDTDGASRITLYWSSDSTGGAFVVVPSDRLYYNTEVVAGSPVRITVT